MNSVITAWEAHSPLGRTAEGHRQAVLEGPAAPEAGSRLVPGFDIKEALGRKGVRSMDRATALAVVTTGRLLERTGLGKDDRRCADDELGLVLGTTEGSLQSLTAFDHDSYTREKPFDVPPSLFPVVLMNYHAGQCAIWHRIKGPNSTICGSHLTSLLALSYACRLQSNGHARAVLAGAVEECSDARDSYEQARNEDDPQRPSGEGCVMFLLEPAGPVGEDGPGGSGGPHREGATVVAVEFGFFPEPDLVRPALRDCLTRALDRAGVEPGKVAAVAPSPVLGPRGEAELAAIAQVFGDVPLATASLDALGDTRAAATGFQLAELLSRPGEPGRLVAATATDAEGRVGCALLRIG
ncbi:beta-ketoacyl synthase N-terminal-like domain-containing protein [Kitasatospora sp. NPDC087314]|uniref:beta-ketoacyl synthase N-terminal-like domain-containing protein n=1 Tax=Kitasatospora sp. NPDC087314 TaxID=3364068 RepID=UPI003821FF4A